MVQEVSLDGLWRFKGYKECNGEELGAYAANAKMDDWLIAEAPLTAHTNLMANKLIPDPFKGTNEREVQWVHESEWWYRKEIELTSNFIGKDVVEVVFASLDTFATVWVNDVKVGEANNMFTPWRFNIKDAVKAGINVISIRFKPIYKVAEEIEAKYKDKYACLSADNCSARPYVRKAQYSFGWDWGPTLPTAGIWRKAKVVAYNTASLGYIAGIPEKVSAKSANIKLSAQIYSASEGTLSLKFSLTGFGEALEQTVSSQVTKGRNFIESEFVVNNPKLWWPKGYGEPDLYDASVQIFSGDQLLDEASIKVGIRSIELIQEPDEEGVSFIFRINGKNIFCKGANWIPADSFLPKVNFEQYNNLLNLAAQANFNMLRVWGGGVYEADEFYDLCDSLGIMVWQDFMYVCAGYPEEDWFLREAEREAMESVLRLRGHPSIVLWCGNNENQWLHNILWKTRDKVDRLWGSKIYESLLFQVCSTLDPTRPYRPSSPFGGEDASGRHEGDRHNWEVWSHGLDYTAYLQDDGRFLSEFGWQAPPSMELLTTYLEKEELTPNSFAFRAHEKQTGGLELLRALLAVHYPVPEDMNRFVLYSQLNQGEALRTAVTYWRSRMFKTSGCLIWQLNDCWPVISWSLIDYGLHPKAAYYYVKRAYQPIIAPLFIKNGRVYGYVVNETEKELDALFKIEAFKFTGQRVHSESKKVTTQPYSSTMVFDSALENLPIPSDILLAVSLEVEGKQVFSDCRTLREPKDLTLPTPKIKIDLKQIDDKTFDVTLVAPEYAKAVKLSSTASPSIFSDNFFDLIPNNPKTIKCEFFKPTTEENLSKALRAESYPYMATE